MHFAEFAHYLHKLEETSSRIALVEILAEMFGRVDVDEVGPTTYLLQGRLTPVFKPVEFGMGNAYLADAIATAYGGGRTDVLHRFDQLGDFGTVARELAEARTAALPRTSTSVNAVFDRLLSVATTGGPGSVGRKVALFASLLSDVDPLSAAYLCRVPTGRLRLGVGDPTVLEAFALAKLGDRRLRKELKRAYNETSDLGLVGETLPSSARGSPPASTASSPPACGWSRWS